MNEPQSVAWAIIVASLALAIPYLVWYGFALSRLFPRLGAEGWKGWVPVLNEIEILVRGGVPGWSVVFYFIPVVQLYGIYLKATALHRINESFGRGAGFTVLGIFLPPLWATLLAADRMPADGEYDRRVESLLAVDRTVPPPGPDALGGAPLPAASEPADDLSEPEPAEPDPVPAPEPTITAPSPAAGTIRNPWAPIAPATTPDPDPVVPPAIAPAVWTPAPAAAETPTPVPEESTAPAEPVLLATNDDEPAQGADDDDDGELDRTVVVDRRPVVAWRLVTDDGHVIPIRTRTALLGRKPVTVEGDIDVIAVPDSTKTLSKNHARLELSDEGIWTAFDLDSTNGVIVIEPDGTETLLPQGGSAPVPGRFMLGQVAMRVSFDDMEASR